MNARPPSQRNGAPGPPRSGVQRKLVSAPRPPSRIAESQPSQVSPEARDARDANSLASCARGRPSPEAVYSVSNARDARDVQTAIGRRPARGPLGAAGVSVSAKPARAASSGPSAGRVSSARGGSEVNRTPTFAYLRVYGLNQYARAFVAAGFHDLETIGRLSETEVLDFLESLRIYPGHKLRLLRAIECLRHAAHGADRREEQMLEDDAALQRLCSQNSELTREKVEAENESKKWQQENRRLLEVVREQGAELQRQRDRVLELEELVQTQTEQVDFLTSQLHAFAQAAGPETLNGMFQSDFQGRKSDKGETDWRIDSDSPHSPRLAREHEGNEGNEGRPRAFSDSDSLTLPLEGFQLPEQTSSPFTQATRAQRAKFAKSMEIPSNTEVDNLIRCLATALQNKVILSVGKSRPHTSSAECLAACAIFLEPVCKEMLEKQARPRDSRGDGGDAFNNDDFGSFGTPLSSMCSPLMSKASAEVPDLNKPSPFNSIAVRRIPNKWDIYDFLELVINALEVHPEVSVVTLVYLDRFCEMSGMSLTPDNWQRLTITAMMLASKVWYDESYENLDFAQKFDLYSLNEINTFERIFLKCVCYDMSVKAVKYAQTYFFLRTLGAKDSTEFTLQPLDEAGESKLQERCLAKQVEFKRRYLGDGKDFTVTTAF